MELKILIFEWGKKNNFYEFFIDSLKSYWRYEYHYEGVYESPTWSPAADYSNDSSDIPPWRVAGMGPFNGILLIADSHPKNFENHCNISDYGLTV